MSVQQGISPQMGAPQGTCMSVTPTGASPGLDGGANGEIVQKDNVIGADSTLESTKLEPLKPETGAATGSSTTTTDKQVSEVLDGLADSQPVKTAGDLINQAAGLANQAYEAVVGKK